MALRGLFNKITKSVDEIDREKLEEFCAGCGVVPIGQVAPRQRARLAGEIRSVRIVPRAGAAAVEATLHDGHDAVTAVFLGRRRVGGVRAGRRLVVEGMVARDGNRLLMFNPVYELR
jgi:hypothetical protein